MKPSRWRTTLREELPTDLKAQSASGAAAKASNRLSLLTFLVLASQQAELSMYCSSRRSRKLSDEAEWAETVKAGNSSARRLSSIESALKLQKQVKSQHERQAKTLKRHAHEVLLVDEAFKEQRKPKATLLPFDVRPRRSPLLGVEL